MTAAAVGGSGPIDDVFRAVLALGDQFSPSPPYSVLPVPPPGDARDRQQTPSEAAASELLAAAEIEKSRSERQRIYLHCGDIFPTALAAAGQRASGRRAIEGETLVRDGSEQAEDSFYFNLGRSMVQDSFGGSERAVDTTATAAYHRSFR